ncbi:MAG: DUF4831 family protein [Bacteroidales bacterium]
MNRLFLLLFTFSIWGCASQQPPFHVTPASEFPENEEAKKEGLYYALPRNHIVVDVTVEKTQSFPGPFADYASKFLGLNNVIKEKKSSYEIKDIEISTFYEPDPEQYYFVALNNEGMETDERIGIELTEDGLIMNVNSTSGVYTAGEKHLIIDGDSNDHSKTFKHFPDYNMYEKVDTVIQKIHQDTITVEKKVLKRKMVEKPVKQRAKDASDFILKLNEQKMNLLTGFQETPYSKETIEFMVQELDKMEEEYMKLFSGLETNQEYHYRYTYLPSAETYHVKEPLFRFSESKGVLDAADNNHGQPIFLELERQRNADKMQEHIQENYDSTRQVNGFYYRVPEYAGIMVSRGDTPRAEVQLPVSQFGVVHCLPVHYTKIRYYPSTGMIQSIDTYRENKD